MSDCGCHMEAKNAAERKTLRILLLINGTMFVVGIVAGVLADSTALVADSLDMFADASVYTMSLLCSWQIGASQESCSDSKWYFSDHVSRDGCRRCDSTVCLGEFTGIRMDDGNGFFGADC